MDLNRATIIGRLTKDPEARTTTSGINVTSFTVATGSSWVDKTTGEKKEQTEFHNVVAWRKLGEIIAQYMKKGRQIYVEGRIQTRSYDGQDGTKKYRTEIIADNIIMLDGKGNAQAVPTAGQPASNEVRYEPAPQTNNAPATPPPSTPNTEEISIEDIPF
ncbi:MAG: hypothetical protein A2751_02780 [Candidatus Doudnabacteria bacterium RIFCSPHIGHO2_01_FULL_46_14]|uniref:Single-stranded DNA-binding protein n=1 Tax=Candidatus Doudnabacteria bacterium RIFCSPHIGHO2_01_FULL_46_14 TaxID=1817824 RepID=A0A1F5NK69_9BACT|nr:MAG: hypothetical protein A2751_02780 [Candidatus Doudnabacteria bacterium RIFCSPHIGHO2_01_FULL_46_14]